MTTTTKHILVMKRVVEIAVVFDEEDFKKYMDDGTKVWKRLTEGTLPAPLDGGEEFVEGRTTTTDEKGTITTITLANKGEGKRLRWKTDRDDEKDIQVWFEGEFENLAIAASEEIREEE
jgi:hypothetical protein